MSARFDNCIFAALGLEMIFRLIECNTSALLDVVEHFLGKIDMAVQTGTDRGAAQRNFAQSFDGFLRTRLGVGDLLRVTRKFLAEPDWRRIHQMRPANLDDVPEFL